MKILPGVAVIIKKIFRTWGDIGTFSFDFAKTITTGEGGMVVFKDENLFKKAGFGTTMVMRTTLLSQDGKIHDPALD